ncbi:UvrD-helicase domain-containing protein [Candidatus Babeliales bacterium]|nr:UvrD-helicase domain-containing protein [Candidatus Babeliales bacterium]MCF7899062.1 UvrD-helicase domain-containing protein [Candidatus Babeliales bacterium]
MNNFNNFLNKELNEPQKQASTKITGPILVIAGAGSGKTRVITSRMANLIINENESHGSIIALTFTNKAAGEMKNRLTQFLGMSYNLPFVGTFHSYALLLLKANLHLLNNQQFTIMDAEDQKALIKKILKNSGLEKQFSPTNLLYQISNSKNKLDSELDQIFTNNYFKEIYLAYETEKNSSHCLDFDDLLLQLLKLFRENNEFRKKFQKKIKHILVDEYQDTNLVQHELLKYMALDNNKNFNLKSICVVGDQDQSIYSWRGAMASNMLNFQHDFAQTNLIKIEQNYRTVQPILDAANSVIKNNQERTPKNLWSEKKAKNRILTVSCHSEIQEASGIANFIKCLSKNTSLNNIAILYRTHYQSRNIEEALLRYSIPYKIIGGIRFYERKEIKDLLAYLRLIINPYDRTSLFRIINCPTRGLGAKFEKNLYSLWLKNPLLDFKQILELILNNSDTNLSVTKNNSVQNFLNIFSNLKKEDLASNILETIIDSIEYTDYLQKAFDQKEAQDKIENVKEFVQSIYNFEKNKEKISEKNLENFLSEVALMQEKMDSKEKNIDQVQCMTLHAAKGLEFENIIISGLEEGVLPSSRSLSTNKELEEERRLFYVGMTRAKERLTLFRSNYRNTYGQSNDQVISRFLLEIPENLIKNIDISENIELKTTDQFCQWLGIKNTNSNILTFGNFGKKIIPAQKILKTQKNNSNNFKSFNKLTFNNNIWKKNQLVKHTKFGTGIIKNVEKKDEKDFYLTINFKVGEKKILSNFVKKV